MKRRVLIVSPHFPPVNAPDMHRVRTSLPGFVESDWEVTVLTVNDPTPVAPWDHDLMQTIPAAVRVERAHCFSRTWTGVLGINNVALRALPFSLFLRGCRLLGANRYDGVYFSTTMFSVLPLGRIWQMLFGVPYVIDLQDPWVSDYYEQPGAPRPPGGWKYRVVHLISRGLEAWTMKSAAHLIVVSARYAESLRQRYPSLQSLPATELPFGSPDGDIALVRAQLATRPPILPTGSLRIAFAGALGPGMLVCVERLFAAIAVARSHGLAVTAHFFGTSYSPSDEARPATLELAKKHQISDAVQEQPQRLGYLDALQVALEADVNLILGSTDLAFTPSKILAMLAIEKPVLAIAPAGSAMLGRLSNLGVNGIALSATASDAETQRIATHLSHLAGGHQPEENRNIDAYRAKAAAAQQLQILESVIVE